MWNILSCKRHTELASHSLDRKLTAKEKIQYYIHHLICIMCRRFERQLRVIQGAAKILCDEPAQNECLSDEAKNRIRHSLTSQQ